MNIGDYFFLDSTDETEPVLGKPTKKELEKRRRKKITHTFLSYFFVTLGVLAQFLFGSYLLNKTQPINSVSYLQILLALIVGAAVFPSVYRSVGFDRKKPHPIQYFLAFQNGFFWQGILQALSVVK